MPILSQLETSMACVLRLAILPLLLTGCVSATEIGALLGHESPPEQKGITAPLSAERLIGNWGFASYHDGRDAESSEERARAACEQPYPIRRGRNNTVLLHEPFASGVSEMSIKTTVGATYIGPGMEANRVKDREVLRWDGRVLVTRFVHPHAATVYGNMIMVRCGSHA